MPSREKRGLHGTSGEPQHQVEKVSAVVHPPVVDGEVSERVHSAQDTWAPVFASVCSFIAFSSPRTADLGAPRWAAISAYIEGNLASTDDADAKGGGTGRSVSSFARSATCGRLNHAFADQWSSRPSDSESVPLGRPSLGRADIGAIENPEVERQGQTAGAGRHRRRKRSGRSRAMSFDS